DGRGTATYAYGDVYEGMFSAGRRQGEGTMRYATGQEVTGVWQNGTPPGADGADDAAPAAEETPADAPTAAPEDTPAVPAD
ncbi:MAG: 2-isopropylmalate synthase, partial [Paracoccaceae bacterium]